MLYSALKISHLLSVIVWLGGMVFAHFFLRPAVASLEPAPRLRLMHEVLGRFLRTVQWLVLLIVLTGGWLMGRSVRQTVQAEVGLEMPLEWMLMATLGTVMALVFVLVRLRFYPALDQHVRSQNWPLAAASLARIRQGVLLNIGLGTVIVVVTLAGLSS